jgi:paraquat-inducible protein A
VAGIILFFVSNLFPFLTLDVGGMTQQVTLLSGVKALLQREQWLLAMLVFSTIFLFPLMELLGLAYLLLPAALRRPLAGQRWVLHFLLVARPWSMLDVFLLGVFVATVKLREWATIVPGPALWAFLGLVFVLLAAHQQINHRWLWSWIEPHDCFVNDAQEVRCSCHVCGALVGVTLVDRSVCCPRCGAHVRRRIHQSVQKTSALLVGAALLYFPANLLPIMTSTSLGKVQSDTIFSGVVYLLQSGMWPLALVVFVASVLVPIAKMGVLFYLLRCTNKGSEGRHQQARLYRMTEFVGRWSMVDLYVVILLVALVQFGLVANVEPGGAALAFGGVVILTMLAAETFDPRLLWDRGHESKLN